MKRRNPVSSKQNLLEQNLISLVFLFTLWHNAIAVSPAFAQAEKTAQSRSGQAVVATINDRKITLQEFQRRYNEVRSSTINPPPSELFLEDLVRYEVGVMEAEKRNLRKDPAVIERVNQELYKGLVERAIGEKVAAIKISDKEMADYYKNNPEMRSSHILIEFRPGAKPEEKASAFKRAKEIYEEVKASNRPFEELVKLYSDDVLSKRNNGDVGWQTRLTIMPNFYETLLKMKLNEVTGLVETTFGYHIVKLTGRRPYDQANKQQVRAAVFDLKRKVIFDQFFADLKKSYNIKTNVSLIK